MEGLQPTFDVNGGENGMGVGGAAAAGGLIGGLFGSWFSNGFNGGNGRNGGSVAGVEVAGAALLDAVNSVGSSVNSGNMALCQGFGGLNGVIGTSANATQMAVVTAAGGVGSAVNAVNNTVQQGNFNLQSALCQGFSAAISNNDRNFAAAAAQNADCCCTLRTAISDQGCLTRELIKDVQTQQLRDELCDTKNKLAQCETIAAVTANTDQKIAIATNQIIGHVQAICSPRKCGSDS